MTTLFFSFLFFLFSHMFFNFSFVFEFSPASLMMLMVFPLVAGYVWSANFNFSNILEMKTYKTIFFFFFFFLLLCFSGKDSFFFLLTLEMCVCFMIYFLLNFSKDSDKTSSVVFMFITNILGSIPFMLFCLSASNTISNMIFSTYFSNLTLFLCFSLILVSKLPLFFFHFWLTKAHVSASGSGSVILASLMLKIGSMGLLKWGPFFSFFLLGYLSYINLLSVISSCILLVVMNRLFDLKYLVACSSVVHMSLIFPFLFMGTASFYFSSVLMMVGHGVISCVVFFLVSVLYEFSLSRSISSGKSTESFSPIFCMILFFWFLMNLGFPPFISFLSELYFFFCCFLVGVLPSIFFFLILMLSGLFFVSICLSFIFSKKNSYISSGSLSFPYCYPIGSGFFLLSMASFL